MTPYLWERIGWCLPPPKPRPRRRRDRKGGRPPLPDLACFNALIWLIHHDQPWRALPKEFGSPKTVRKRVRRWDRLGLMPALWKNYLGCISDRERRELFPILRQREAQARPTWEWPLATIFRLEYASRHDGSAFKLPPLDLLDWRE